ncbi:hypothetical protein HZH66_014785 [Vespula vulgaris]|uniref:Uncharacterized protein n=1 Tax=Vespula vulgaris TaxID=7454 RepID=A0A834MPY3_VESVU|nr:hypothetical protein HZH66_014785 [Vespula vulgaris]
MELSLLVRFQSIHRHMENRSSCNIKYHVPADEQEQRTGHFREQWDTSHADHLLYNFCYSNKKSAKEYCLPKLHFSSTFGRRDSKRERKDLLIDVEEEVEEGRDTEDEEEQGKAKDYESIIVYDSFDDRYYPDDDHSTNKFNSNRNDVGLRPINDFANHDLNSIIFNTLNMRHPKRNIFTWSSCSSVHLITSPTWIIQTSDHQSDQGMKTFSFLVLYLNGKSMNAVFMECEFITNLSNIMKPKLARVAPNDPEYGNEMLLLLRHYYSNHRLLHWILINEHIGLSEEWFEKWLENLLKETAPLLIAER